MITKVSKNSNISADLGPELVDLLVLLHFKFFYFVQDDPEVKMLVLLGEVGGVEEYKVCEALKSGRINKPMVAWCIGTCGDMFSTDVQVCRNLVSVI